MDIAYIGLPTNSSTIGIDLDEDITLHFDTQKREIIGLTILHWERIKKKLELRNRAKESVKVITNYLLKKYSNLPVLPIYPNAFSNKIVSSYTH
ncbi:MAG: DUF2283 domain-containing protein [Candidatus Omnitrophica bacterium]|nr:DUF2283 domain-containing protein [Candidatus Omnitrophota bacterium]